MENQKNEKLWKEAEARAGFKSHFTTYILANVFFIGIWYFSGGSTGRHFWPIWAMLGWGVGLLSHYLGVYRKNLFFSTETEYEKLMQKENK
jgi:hypothetical protein